MTLTNKVAILYDKQYILISINFYREDHCKFRIFVEKTHQHTVLLKTLNANSSHIQDFFNTSPPPFFNGWLVESN